MKQKAIENYVPYITECIATLKLIGFIKNLCVPCYNLIIEFKKSNSINNKVRKTNPIGMSCKYIAGFTFIF